MYTRPLKMNGAHIYESVHVSISNLRDHRHCERRFTVWTSSRANLRLFCAQRCANKEFLSLKNGSRSKFDKLCAPRKQEQKSTKEPSLRVIRTLCWHEIVDKTENSRQEFDLDDEQMVCAVRGGGGREDCF